jgi:hypothetical protein
MGFPHVIQDFGRNAPLKSFFPNAIGTGMAQSETVRFWKGCKPNFVCVACAAERIICLGSRYPESVRFRGTGAGRSGIPYLALHPMGFSVPRRLRFARCALTAPFHPCQL